MVPSGQRYQIQQFLCRLNDLSCISQWESVWGFVGSAHQTVYKQTKTELAIPVSLLISAWTFVQSNSTISLSTEWSRGSKRFLDRVILLIYIILCVTLTARWHAIVGHEWCWNDASSLKNDLILLHTPQTGNEHFIKFSINTLLHKLVFGPINKSCIVCDALSNKPGVLFY